MPKMPRAQKSESASCRGTRQRRRRKPATNDLNVSGEPDELLSSTSTSSSGDSYLAAQGDGRCSAIYGYNPPYMDVRTVKNNLTVDQAAKLEGQSHCLLLVEPVILPDLGHTGVRREILPNDHPIFYLDGHKHCGLSATIHKALYESTCNRKQKELRDRDQQPSSEQSDSSVCATLFDSPSRTRCEDEFGAVTKGHQCGKFPSDVWEETRPGVRDARKHRSGTISTNKTRSSTLGHAKCEEGDGKRSLSENTAARLQRSGTLLVKSQQQQHQQPATHSEGDTSTLAFGAEASSARVTSHKRSSAPSWRRQDELRGGGRDSEWSKERRAADQEAREILSAVRQNSLMISLLVGSDI